MRSGDVYRRERDHEPEAEMRQLLQGFPGVPLLDYRSVVSDGRLRHTRWIHLPGSGGAQRDADEQRDAGDAKRLRAAAVGADGSAERSPSGELVVAGRKYPRKLHGCRLHVRQEEGMGWKSRGPGAAVEF